MSVIHDFESNLNIFAGKCPPCTGVKNCTADDKFIWSWCSCSNLRPDIFRQICYALLCQAALRSDIVLPNDDRTIVSCKGIVHTIEWESFAMTIFNDPAPTNALDATLASCLLSMRAFTENHTERLSYGKHSLDSGMVFSRSGISESYKTLAGKSLKEMSEGLQSIEILDFLEERSQFEDLEAIRADRAKRAKQDAAKKTVGKAKRGRSKATPQADEGESGQKRKCRGRRRMSK